MGTTKAICIKQHPQLAGLLDIGDQVDIVSILSTEPKVICNAWRRFDSKKW